eukprot:TRINITY_DN179_c0_g1_i3.p1 TRINITY_DN179_c0_g1~~TRINITY_DN179_c0_g1_i3.p1  ORF type:complete len:328 (+),score=53.17 TRINITY_DN179_c0_g1_i3:358-1341(+)
MGEVISRETFTYYEFIAAAPAIYCVLWIITMIFLIKAIKNFRSCADKHKIKHQRIIILYSLTAFFIACDILSCALYNPFDMVMLTTEIVFTGIAQVTFFVKFLYLLAIWVELVLGQNNTVQSSRIYKYRKLIFVLCGLWLAFGVVFHLSTQASYDNLDLLYAGVTVFVFNVLCVAVTFTVVAIMLYRLMKHLKNTEKGKTFRRRLTVVASLYIAFLYLYIAYYFNFLYTKNWGTIPIESTIFFQNVSEFGCVIVILWFMNPFRRSGSQKGKDGKGSGSGSTSSDGNATTTAAPPNSANNSGRGSSAGVEMSVSVQNDDNTEDIDLAV